jgi:hypothetical protein
MLQVLQQQQQHQQRQLSVATVHGLPVFQSMAGHHDIRTPGAGTTAQRFMVDDFAGAGALLSRPEQEFLLARGFPNMALPGMSAFPSPADAMDLSHTSKLADFLLAKQAAALSSAQLLPKMTRLPCQARGMKADHNGTVCTVMVTKLCRFDSGFLSAKIIRIPHNLLTRAHFLFLNRCHRRPFLRFPKTLVMDSTCCVVTRPADRQVSSSDTVFFAESL